MTRVWLLAVAVLLLADCSKSVDPKSKPFVYPLALGNTWTYKVTDSWEQRVADRFDTVWVESTTVILTIDHVDTIRPGVITYTMQGMDLQWKMFDFLPKRTYLNLPEGLYLVSKLSEITNLASWSMPRRAPYRFGSNPSAPYLTRLPTANCALLDPPDPGGSFACQAALPADTLPLVLAYPLEAGSSWVYHDSVLLGSSWVNKRIEGQESITTAAGSFVCWRIRFFYGPPVIDADRLDWVSPEGLIRRRLINESSDGRYTSTADLQSFSLH